MGFRGDWHYFALGSEKGRKFKVSRKEFPVDDEFELTENWLKWASLSRAKYKIQTIDNVMYLVELEEFQYQDASEKFENKGKRFKAYSVQAIDFGETSGNESTKSLVAAIKSEASNDVPVLSFLNFNGKGIKIVGLKMPRLIKWKLEGGAFGTNPITIELNYDEINWIPVIRNIPNTGKFMWVLSENINSKNAKLRITAIDIKGKVYQVVSKDFVIDSIPPRSGSGIKMIPFP